MQQIGPDGRFLHVRPIAHLVMYGDHGLQAHISMVVSSESRFTWICPSENILEIFTPRASE